MSRIRNTGAGLWWKRICIQCADPDTGISKNLCGLGTTWWKSSAKSCFLTKMLIKKVFKRISLSSLIYILRLKITLLCTCRNDSLYLVNPILDALNRCYLRFPACSSENLPVRWRLGLKLLCIGGLQEHVMTQNRERPLLLISLQSCSPNETEFTTRKFNDIMRVYR